MRISNKKRYPAILKQKIDWLLKKATIEIANKIADELEKLVLYGTKVDTLC